MNRLYNPSVLQSLVDVASGVNLELDFMAANVLHFARPMDCRMYILMYRFMYLDMLDLSEGNVWLMVSVLIGLIGITLKFPEI